MHLTSDDAAVTFSHHTFQATESNIIRLPWFSPKADCLQPFEVRLTTASLALFYPTFHLNCLSELANCISIPASLFRYLRVCVQPYHFVVQLFNAKMNQYFYNFTPFACELL